ncbi:hypothetical protein GCM10010353_47060 [Streptomyces chryseus]|nr:hypothetical protein GCM10010353_47060 [Streptomyces chryseus]
MKRRLTATQRNALAQIRSAGVWHAYNGISYATLSVLERAGLVTVEHSVTRWRNRRSGRAHSQREWVARPTSRKEGASTWRRVASGFYERIGSDGETVLAEVVKGITSTGGSYYRECWNSIIYPRGKKQCAVTREGYRTAKEAQEMAEVAYRRAVADMAAGRPTD